MSARRIREGERCPDPPCPPPAGGWRSALSIVLLALFVIRQATARPPLLPLLPLRIFRSRAVSGANPVMLPLVAGMFGFQFLTALYLQRLLDLDALRTGFAFLPPRWSSRWSRSGSPAGSPPGSARVPCRRPA
ncbi:hypothetical protein AB0M79_24910 [Polymorphospora sp. NPDC051019]|uniref:hypothetical protein n=1 Tax=Polymorphospora sp. NPDC051019 TaxID=3155725 RepID=UPI00344A6F02